jgi:hypothetical protein
MNVGGKVFLLIPLTMALVGCGDEAADKRVASSDTQAAPAGGNLKHRAASSLPKIGDYLPPQDGGTLEVASPAGWKVLPRGAFVAGFYKTKQNELPRITVDAQPANLGGITDATEENAEALTKKLAAIIGRQSNAIQEPPRPIVLGETVFVRHVRLAKHGGSPAVIQSLQTVQNGRLYTVELFCEVEAARGDEYEGSLKKWRDQGYAVAANLRFLKPNTEPAAEPATEPSTEPPAVETPAEPPTTEPSAAESKAVESKAAESKAADSPAADAKPESANP